MPKKEIHKNTECTPAKDLKAWSKWLEKNHIDKKSVFLILYKKNSGISSITKGDAIQEALCWGWVDSKVNSRDEKSYYLYFSKRNPKSNWSAINKRTILKLKKENRLQPAGIEMIKLAKKTGTWDALNDVDNLIVPHDLKEALSKRKSATENFNAFSPSMRRGILEWIFNAKKPETRTNRIEKTASLAAQNKPPL